MLRIPVSLHNVADCDLSRPHARSAFGTHEPEGADNAIPENSIKDELLTESAITLNKTWGYKATDREWKSAERVPEIKRRLNSRGVNMLLNIGPDPLGRFPSGAVKVLRDLAALRAQGEE